MPTADALAVPRRRAERARQELGRRGIARTDLKIGRRGDEILLPAVGPRGTPPEGGRWVRVSFEPLRKARSYKDLAEVPAKLRPLLPTSFDVVGDLVLIKLPKELLPFGARIGRALLAAHHGLRAAYLDEGVKGTHRQRRLRKLAGRGGTRTVHREYGLAYAVDVARAYFSPRLAELHRLVSDEAREGEKILDLTAGVGPFAIPIARRLPTARVTAVDSNPVAVRLLTENARRNGAAGRIDIRKGDGFSLATKEGPWDRVIVNLPHAPEGWVRRVATTVRPGGTLQFTRVLENRGRDRSIASLAAESKARVLRVRAVHPYSPYSTLVLIEFEKR